MPKICTREATNEVHEGHPVWAITEVFYHPRVAECELFLTGLLEVAKVLGVQGMRSGRGAVSIDGKPFSIVMGIEDA